MTLITIRNLGVTLGTPLFSGLNLVVNAGDRIGLVAANGRGKSTLLRCVAGTLEANEGEITRSRGLTVGYVEQDVPENLLDLPLTEAIRRALPPADREANAWRCGLALDMFDTPADLHDRPLRALSGGWQRFALIARAWITEPDLLLLDEPTNHLDLDRLAVLEDWIRYGSEGVAMLIASHDRQFLDDCTTRTLFLRAEISRDYAHPFSKARALMDADDAAQEAVLAKDANHAKTVPLQRFGTEAEISAAIVYLLSPAAATSPAPASAWMAARRMPATPGRWSRISAASRLRVSIAPHCQNC